MRINTKMIIATFLVCGVFTNVYAGHKNTGQEIGKKIDNAEEKVEEKAQDAKKKTKELAKSAKKKAKETKEAAKKKAHKAIDKS